MAPLHGAQSTYRLEYSSLVVQNVHTNQGLQCSNFPVPMHALVAHTVTLY